MLQGSHEVDAFRILSGFGLWGTFGVKASSAVGFRVYGTGVCILISASSDGPQWSDGFGVEV